MGGTYTLCVALEDSADIEVGALGDRSFDAGWYAYVGTALGPGGFSRVDRHRELASGERETRHWHIDYLLGRPESHIDTVVTTDGVDGECAVADAIDATEVPDFGCSDCGCSSHLYYHADRSALLGAVEAAHEAISR